MKNNQFWKQVEQRVEENETIVHGGFPSGYARVLEWVGLRFWIVGLWASLFLTLWLWISSRPTLLQIVRLLIWR